MQIRDINTLPVLKSLPLLGLFKKAIYTLYIAHNSIADDKIGFREFEIDFLNKDIELQKIELYQALTMRLSSIDECIEILDVITPFVFKLFDGKEISISSSTINTLEEYKEIMQLILNNSYEAIIRKKLIQL